MSKDVQKKRKRNDNEADGASARPGKALKTTDAIPVTIDGQHVKKRGESRQAKSERRSKKSKPVRKTGTENARVESEIVEKAPLQSMVDNSITTVFRNDAVINEGSAVPGKGTKPRDDGFPGTKDGKRLESSKTATSNAPRFIVFVGNLPYDATTPQIEEHFAKVAPFEVRHRVDKETGQSRGFAFIEFKDYDKMKTTLQLYHHSIFDPNAREKGLENEEDLKSDKRKGRKLNVELTVGGGGSKSQSRKEKIKAKNEKLTGQRARKRKAEQEKAEKSKKEKPTTESNNQIPENPDGDHGSIHPSRLSRVRR